MIRLATALMLVSTATGASEWTSPDKTLHFKYGVVIGAVTVTAFNYAQLDVNRPLAAALACSLVGVGKEVRDEYIYRGADIKDFTITAVACFIGSYSMYELVNATVSPVPGGVMLNFTGKF